MLRKLKYLFISLALFMYCEQAQGQSSSYEQLQAAYIFNFAKYIKWPLETAAFVIGVSGESEIMNELQNTLKGKKVAGRLIELKVITTTEEASKCNIVYLPESNSRELNALRTALTGKQVLIVTEEDLIKKGACISFFVEDDRLRFKLKKAALAEAGLEAMDGLLRLADIQ